MVQLNESQKHYAQLISEELHVTDKAKLNWMAQYAQVHALYESVDAGNAGAGIYATPLNTMGAANPALPMGTPGAEYDAVNGAAFHNPAYQKGSGDVPMSTLSTALEIAAVTIGFDLVPVVPSAGPMAFLTFNDYPYAGGKLGLANETYMDGKGAGADNKPIYIKLASQNLDEMTKVAASLTEFGEYTATLTVSGIVKDFKGLYMGTSRIDGGIILQVEEVKNTTDSADISLSQWAAGSNTVAVSINGEDINDREWTVQGAQTSSFNTTYDHEPVIEAVQGHYYIDGEDSGETEPNSYVTGFYAVVPELVKGVTDHIQSFSNFVGNRNADGTYAGPSNDPMSRAENETGTGNTIGARMFSKVIRMGSYEAVGTVTRQQLQDMPLYGIDVLGGVIEACQNEISQAINNRILDRLFKLGVSNYEVQKSVQGVDLNLYISQASNPGKKLSNFSGGAPYKKYVDINGNHPADVTIPNSLVAASYENVTTNQRRIMSRMLAASNLISSVTRRGRAQWAVTNAQVLTALQDCQGFIAAPMVNDLVQGGEESLYFAGTLAGMKIYVDPLMRWDDTRICVGRKATVNNNRVQGSGVVFLPYILADQVQIIAEGTMAPKVLINSRFAIADCGWYPEQNYYTFMVDMDGINLI